MIKEEHLKEVFEIQKRDFIDRINDLNALKKEFGDKVVDVVLRERSLKVQKQWQEIARNHGKNDIEGLKETLWAWVQDAGFEFTYSETEDGTQFNVTRCPLAEIARSVDAADWGYTCFCADDEHIVKGFNPEMKFNRTKTLMEGHDCCTHLYFLSFSN
jgi:fumarate reductase iron-sulfur subunit